MAQVSNESELSAALAGTDPSIQLTADIPVTNQLEVGRDVTISSLFPDVFALTKAGHSQNLFRVASGASLHLNNIILDGDMASHPASDSANRSLICVNGGSLSGGRLYPAEQLFCGGRRRRLSPGCPHPGQFTCNEWQFPDYRLCVQNLRRRCRHVSGDLQ